MVIANEVPRDRDAEQAVIGCVLGSPTIWRHVELTGDDFYWPAHVAIWRAMGELDAAGRPPEPLAVLEQLRVKGWADRCGGAPYLHTCQAATPITANVAYYAEIVRNKAHLRRLIDALTRGLQIAQEGASEPEEIHETVERLISSVPSRDTGDFESLMSGDDFLDRDLGPVHWLVPGLLQREERLIVTAAEGVGKSMLIRQLGMCAAAGVHPFTGRTMQPSKVLLIDVENPERIMQERLGEIRHALRAHGATLADRFWIDRRMGGLNLADPADRRWLNRRVDAVQPDMLVIGPAYKLYVGGSHDRDEDLARLVTACLDAIRERVGCALVVEHHSAKATEGKKRTVQPFGSSLWMRWPEFGIGLQPADHPEAKARRLVDVIQWRGPRDNRAWPHRLETGGDWLPWIESLLL